MEELLAALNLTPPQVAAVGDELVDLPLFHRVGLGAAVADAVPEVLAAAHWVTPGFREAKARSGRSATWSSRLRAGGRNSSAPGRSRPPVRRCRWSGNHSSAPTSSGRPAPPWACEPHP